MAHPAPERSARRPVDAAALAHIQRRLLGGAAPLRPAAAEPSAPPAGPVPALRADGPAQAPWLHGEAARRMAERLPVIKLKPERILDWGAFLGGSHEVLARTYPQAQITAVEPHAARRDATAAALQRPWWSASRWRGTAPQALSVEQVAPGSGQLLWSNMGLHGVVDPQAEMVRWHRAVAVDGFLMFSTLGPGTLRSLSALYAAQGWPPPMAPLVDMHDLGDMLVEAGFADPVMDQETLTLTWVSPEALLAELRQLGGNVDPHRAAGLRTPRWRDRLCTLLAATAEPDGRIGLDFEIVYGHAFRPAPRARLAARTEVPLADMRAMMRSGGRRS